MKHSATILFFLFFCNVYGQKWHLNNIDESSKFKYEYWFQFENTEDSSSYSLKKIEGKSKSTILLTDNKSDTVLLAIIKIKDLHNDSTFKIMTDFYGISQLLMRPGKYNIEISASNYDKFSFDLSILENEFFNLHVKLGLAPELEVYQINSIAELKEAEILKIMKCVKENSKDFYKNCSDQKKFYILMHI